MRFLIRCFPASDPIRLRRIWPSPPGNIWPFERVGPHPSGVTQIHAALLRLEASPGEPGGPTHEAPCHWTHTVSHAHW